MASTTCFDPAVDSLSIEASQMFVNGDAYHWIKYFAKTYPALMSKIRQVEIAEVTVHISDIFYFHMWYSGF